MSRAFALFEKIKSLSSDELAEVLEFNGYAECVGAIQTKNIDGEEFLNLTELNISLWRLPTVHARRLWSFLQLVRSDPEQFLMNVPRLPKPLLLEKPSSRLNQFQKPLRLLDKNQAQMKKTTFSTVTRQKNEELKNKLEMVFKKDLPEHPNTSFIYSQKQPRLPPKPEELKLIKMENLTNQEEADFNDGYLSPISKRKDNTFTVNESNSEINTTGNTFLNKFRKPYENLETRPEVIENKYEEKIKNPSRQISVERPLPPIPKAQCVINNTPTLHLEDNEELPHYTPIIEEKIEKKSNIKKLDSFNRHLAKIVIQSKTSLIDNKNSIIMNDEEDLPEYADVDEDEEVKISDGSNIRKLNYHRPLPPIPLPSPPAEISVHKRSLTPILINERNQCVASQQVNSTNSKLKPRAEIPRPPNEPSKRYTDLPKPPNKLPISPLEVPASIPLEDDNLLSAVINFQQRRSPIPSNFNQQQDHKALTKDDNLLSVTNLISSQPESRTSPMLLSQEQIQNLPEEEDDLFYTEIDLATLPSYRETDRKGARRLLSGLEDGVFLVRPSRQPEYVCTLSIMTAVKMYNLGIEKQPDGSFGFGVVNENFQQPRLYSVGEIIDFYSKTPIYLSGEYILLKDILPRSKR